MRGEVPTIRPVVPTPPGDAEWSARGIGGPRPTRREATRQSSIRNHQSEAVYEYDVYGQVAASDPNHPNRFMFTGREFDTETGLYYYRARYYNPTIGRFLQTDPIGYDDGMNAYAYGGNDPVGTIDPSGCAAITGYLNMRGKWYGLVGDWNAWGVVFYARSSSLGHIKIGTAPNGLPVYWIEQTGLGSVDDWVEFWSTGPQSGHMEGTMCDLGTVPEFLSDISWSGPAGAGLPSGAGLSPADPVGPPEILYPGTVTVPGYVVPNPIGEMVGGAEAAAGVGVTAVDLISAETEIGEDLEALGLDTGSGMHGARDIGLRVRRSWVQRVLDWFTPGVDPNEVQQKARERRHKYR